MSQNENTEIRQENAPPDKSGDIPDNDDLKAPLCHISRGVWKRRGIRLEKDSANGSRLRCIGGIADQAKVYAVIRDLRFEIRDLRLI